MKLKPNFWKMTTGKVMEGVFGMRQLFLPTYLFQGQLVSLLTQFQPFTNLPAFLQLKLSEICKDTSTLPPSSRLGSQSNGAIANGRIITSAIDAS